MSYGEGPEIVILNEADFIAEVTKNSTEMIDDKTIASFNTKTKKISFREKYVNKMETKYLGNQDAIEGYSFFITL